MFQREEGHCYRFLDSNTPSVSAVSILRSLTDDVSLSRRARYQQPRKRTHHRIVLFARPLCSRIFSDEINTIIMSSPEPGFLGICRMICGCPKSMGVIGEYVSEVMKALGKIFFCRKVPKTSGVAEFGPNAELLPKITLSPKIEKKKQKLTGKNAKKIKTTIKI